MQDRELTSGREALVAEFRQIARSEREERKFLAGLLEDDPEARAEDNLVNFLSTVGHSRVVTHLREIERMAVYGATVRPSAEEIDLLWHVRYLYELIEEIGTCITIAGEEVATGKRSIKRRKQAIVKEEQLMRHFTDYGYDYILTAMRLAEKRAIFYQGIEMLTHQYEALLIFREFVDRIERLRVVSCPEIQVDRRPRKARN